MHQRLQINEIIKEFTDKLAIIFFFKLKSNTWFKIYKTPTPGKSKYMFWMLNEMLSWSMSYDPHSKILKQTIIIIN